MYNMLACVHVYMYSGVYVCYVRARMYLCVARDEVIISTMLSDFEEKAVGFQRLVCKAMPV